MKRLDEVRIYAFTLDEQVIVIDATVSAENYYLTAQNEYRIDKHGYLQAKLLGAWLIVGKRAFVAHSAPSVV